MFVEQEFECVEDNTESVKPEQDVEASSHHKCKQRIALPSRKETSIKISEFHLTKKKNSRRKNPISLNELAGVLGKGASLHAALSRKVQDVHKNTKTLAKPLEKIFADKVKRQSGFDKAKRDLARWDNIVVANKVADQLEFPLVTKAVNVHNSEDFKNSFRPVTDLEKEMYAVLQMSNDQNNEKVKSDNSYPLTVKEVLEQRKEAAKLRARTAQQQIKAWRHNRIKSKKYHRVLRKEKIRQQIKEFELLKQTNPEEAIKRLNQLERTRAQERASLRHRNTGHWARNKAIHAKYDQECRQVLAQQLALSRELTQKIVKNSDTDSDEDSDQDNELSTNPNLSLKIEPIEEVAQFVSGYRKFWKQRNEIAASISQKNIATLDNESDILKNEISDNETIANDKSIVFQIDRNEKNSVASELSQPIPTKLHLNKKKNIKRIKTANGSWIVTDLKKTYKERDLVSIHESENSVINQEYYGLKATKPSKENIKHEQPKVTVSCNWEEVERFKHTNVSGRKERKFDHQDETKYILEAVVPLRNDLTRTKFLSIPLREESSGILHNEATLNTAENLIHLLGQNNMQDVTNEPLQKEENIDPSNFLVSKSLKSSSAEFVNTGFEDLDDLDDAEEAQHRITIAEAFNEDDVVEDFRKEKEELEEASKPKDIDLTLPGWGSWGGTGLQTSQRKRKRFLLKPTIEPPRKDRNKNNVIINEVKDSGISNHQVNNLPYPFTSVKDFEASIRIPLGTTWIPETAHRKLTAPRVITHQGKIIQPMTEDVLCDKN